MYRPPFQSKKENIMGDNSFYTKNKNRLRRFYENADRLADEDFARQEKEDDLTESTRLSMDFPKQAVEALSKIAGDKESPLQEMSDKEILSLGVFLYNIGNLFYHEGDLGGSRTELSEEIAGMDDSTLKDFYRGILSTDKEVGYYYDVIKDKENRKDITEFIYQIINEDKYFIIEKVTGGSISFYEHERIPPGAFKLFKPCSEDSARDVLLNYIHEKTEQTITDEKEREDYIINNKKIASRPPRQVEDAQHNDAGLPKRAVFARFYDNLQ